VWFVKPHKGQLIWTTPDGKRGPVPAGNIIPPLDRVGDKLK
jgi:hypothetical protein